MEKKKVLNKIICAILLCVVCLSAFCIPCFADMSTLSPRDVIMPTIPLNRIEFPNTAYSAHSSIASPFALYSVNAGYYTDVARFPATQNASGTAVTGLVSFYLQHQVEGGYNTSPKNVYTIAGGGDWGNLTSPYLDANNFSSIILYYDSFVNPYYADYNLRNTVVIAQEDNEFTATEIVIADIDYDILVDGNSEFEHIHISTGLSKASQDGTHEHYLNFRDVIGQFSNSKSYITNLVIRLNGVDPNKTNYIQDFEYIAFDNTFLSLTDYNSMQTEFMPSTVHYKQVINEKNPSDLLDWLGDTLGDFLSTELFKIGDLSISIGTIVATIFGLLFVFMFLRFFSGG